MREFTKGKQKFVEIDGMEIPYDAVVKIYVDSDTGNWVVSTPYHAQTMFDLLTDAVEHFVEVLAEMQLEVPPEDEEEVPMEVVQGGLLMPMPTVDWN